jgi:hypothetical protein
MDFSFFRIDNKSGYKTKESWFKKNYPEEYSQIIEYASKIDLTFSFKEKIWFFFNKLKERPKCQTCGNDIDFRERFDKPYGDFCSLDCINTNKDEMINRVKKTFNKKYGIDYYPQHKSFAQKVKDTKFLHYGDANFTNPEKGIQTKIEKYGDKNNFKKYIQTCLDKYGVHNYSLSDEFKKTVNDKYASTYPDLDFKDINKFDVKLHCENCNQDFVINKQLLYERSKVNHVICVNCNKIGHSSISSLENQINDYIKSLGIETIQAYRVKGNKEIDIFLPEFNIGIEMNGLYWHNELFAKNDKHINKTNFFKELGIYIIHIFEDEWNYKKEIVKSILSNRFNMNINKIYARKCKIVELTNKDVKSFYNENHIQGAVNSKINIGLMYDNILVSVMSFAKGRIIMSGNQDEWELTRFCNKTFTNIVGGASRLFKFFLDKYKPIKIISYSDIRYFDGSLYEKLGFKEKSKSKPNYSYVINDKRHYRFNFRKSILVKQGFDPNKTEKEIMFERKMYRIYDCGNIRWEFE